MRDDASEGGATVRHLPAGKFGFVASGFRLPSVGRAGFTEKMNPRIIATALGLCAFSSLAAAEWTNLLDKQMSQWDEYLGFRHTSDYTGKEPVDAAGRKIEPIGYSKDPDAVFSILEEKGQLVLRVSGEVYGCLFTRQEYANYRLKMRVKWGALLWPPRTNKLRDSGICYHSVGPAGIDYWRAWMLSQEFQIMEGHMGDYWNIGSTAVDIRAYLPEGAMNAVANELQPFLPFGAKPSLGGFCLRSENHENPRGEWTELELICFEGKSLHIVNGHVVMVLQNSRMMKDGAALPLTRGKIQIQSEASEVFFTDIKIQPIDALPKEYEHLFE